MKITDPPIVTEVLLNTTPRQIWGAITDVEQMRQWYFPQLDSFEANVGFKTEFVIEISDKVFTHQWEVVKVKPLDELTYRWKYQEYSGDSTVTFQILENEEVSVLRVTSKILEDFPQDFSEFRRESAAEGWSYLLGTGLKQYIEKML